MGDILAGVAIAISLVPVLAVVGITLGAGGLDLALGAFVLFLANAAAILIAGAIVFTAAGYAREARDRDERAGRRARIAIIVLVVVLLVPLGWRPRRDPALRALDRRTPRHAEAVALGHRVDVDTVKQSGQRDRHHR